MIDYPGCYTVCHATIETAPATSTDFGVMSSIFYPCNSIDANRYPRSKWLVGPKGFYALGYGRYINLPDWLTVSTVSWFTNSVKMPARSGQSLMQDNGQKIPIAIFSHGLAGNQTTYSTLCGSLASRGFLVLCIEHRDGSASATAKKNYAEKLLYVKAPEGNKEAELRFRQDQLLQRVHEIREAHALLADLNNGTEIKNLLPGSSTTFAQLKGRLDMENSILIGHSFGAATCLAVGQQPDNPFCAVVTLDPWMWTVPKGIPITVPMLSIQAEKFHWRQNMDLLKALWHDPASDKENLFSVVMNTGHQDVSDAPSLVRPILRLLGKAGVSPKNVFKAYDIMIGNFLKRVLEGRSRVLEGVEFENVDSKLVVSGKEAFEHLDRIIG